MALITFMIGNGFDLACGLKSRYIDTYEGYVNLGSSSSVIEKFKKTIVKDIPTWADFEMQLIQYANSLKSESELITCLRDYDEYLSDYLTAEEADFWSKLKDGSREEELVLKEMRRSFAFFYEGLTRNDIRSISNIIGQKANTYRFISFNYTNLFDTFLEKSNASGYFRASTFEHVLHIHGQLGEDVTLGVDNENQLEELPYYISNRLKRNILKPYFLQSYDQTRLEDAARIINDSDIICVFGLSLGASDLTWRKLLAQWLEKDEEKHLVFYNYEYMQKEYHSTAITIRMDDEDNAKERLYKLLFNDGHDPVDKPSVLNKIHVPVGVKIFNIEELLTR